MIAVTNDASSELAHMADVHVELGVGPEHSIAATKTYTAELLALRQVVCGAAGNARLDLNALICAGEEVLAIAEAEMPHVVESLDGADRVLVVGSGLSMGSAKEGALKLMETCALAASGWSASDATHGPLGQVGEGTTVLVLTAGRGSRPAVLRFAGIAAAQGGRVVTVLDRAEDIKEAWAGGVKRPSDDLAPLLEILPIQRAALEVALRRGLDPDRPRGLRKVTMTG